MPRYDYQCIDCGIKDVRIGAVDDHTALCVECGGLMLRLDEDVFAAYAQEAIKEAECHDR